MAGASSQGQQRLQADLHRLLTTLMQREIDDPRLLGISITRLELSKGNQSLSVWIHRIGEENGGEAVEILNRLAPHFQHGLRRALPKKRIPDLRFKWDDAFDAGGQVLDLINKMERS